MKESMLDSTNIKLFCWVEGELKLLALLLIDELVELLALVEVFPLVVLLFTVELAVVLLAAEVLLADEVFVFVEFVEFTGTLGTLVFVAPLGAANILPMLNY